MQRTGRPESGRPESGVETYNLLVRRDDFHQTALEAVRVGALAPGQALLRIERYALTANNVSYAASGEQLGFWKFFAAPEGWGRIPVWGFAEVVESVHPDLRVGERLFGYFPMSSHMVIDVAAPTAGTVSDGAPHRRDLPAVYNLYQRVTEPDESRRDLRALVGPLFLLSFVLDDALKRRDDHHAAAVVLVSASSKTAIGLAYQFRRRRSPRLVGLTAAANVDFVRSLGLYDRVLGYEDIAALADVESAVSIDMAGNAGILRRLHETLGDRLRQSILVGLTHWDGTPVPGAQSDLEATPLPGPAPWFFFGPDHIRDREREMGPDVYQHTVEQAMESFVSGSASWLRVVHFDGADAALAAYRSILAGRTPPWEGVIVRP